MEPITVWPAPVLDALRAMRGDPVRVDPLHGMSLARVFRVRFADGSVIVKRSPIPNEYAFYTRIAPGLRAQAVPIPQLECAFSLDASYWLIIEDVPRPPGAWDGGRALPLERVVAILARLHRATRGRDLDFPDPWPGKWRQGHTDAALAVLGVQPDRRLRERLETLQRESQRLEEPWCWISGDASPPNWGARQDGSLVLFDWEIFRPGMPASDLAPTIAGLGDEAAFRKVAELYIDAWREEGGSLPWSAEEFARSIAVAKAATVVHVLAEYTTGGARVPDSVVDQLSDIFPPWIEQIGAH